MTTGRDRQAQYRVRRRQAGATRVMLWLDAEGQTLVALTRPA